MSSESEFGDGVEMIVSLARLHVTAKTKGRSFDDSYEAWLELSMSERAAFDRLSRDGWEGSLEDLFTVAKEFGS